MGHKHRSSRSTEPNHTDPGSKVDFLNNILNKGGKETKRKTKEKNSIILQGHNEGELSDVEVDKKMQVSHDLTKNNIDQHDSQSEGTVVSKRKKIKVKIQPTDADINKNHKDILERKSEKAKKEIDCENSVKIQFVTETQPYDFMSPASECDERKQKKKKKHKKHHEFSDTEKYERDVERTSRSAKAGSSAFDGALYNKTSDKKQKHRECSEIILKDTVVPRAQKDCKNSKKSCEIPLDEFVNITQSVNGEEVAICVKKHKKHRMKSNSEIESKLIIEHDEFVEKREKFKEHLQESIQRVSKSVAEDLDCFDKVEPLRKRRKYENNEDFQSISVVDVKKHSKKKKVQMSDNLKRDTDSSTVVCDALSNTSKKSLSVNNNHTADQDNLPSSKSTANVPNLGQWKNASIEGDKRKLKFFRLLGGFKDTGTSTSIDNVHENRTGNGHESKYSSMAMKTSEVNKLNAALEGQFEKARNLMFNQQRGVGLGFAQIPDAGKKFHIDALVRKSKKFND